MNRKTHRRRIPALVSFVVLLVVWVFSLGISGCAQPEAARTVATQNAANTEALATNIAALCAAARDQARVQTSAIVQRSRERVARDLIRLRATITPDHPTDAELSDPTAVWTTTLAHEVDVLTARVNAALPADRPAAADSLADAHPATIDLATAAPGFTSARIFRDAVALDQLNATIADEPTPEVRAGLLTRRNTIFDPYLPVRTASDLAARYLAALDRHLAEIDRQTQIVGLHAKSLSDYTATSSPSGSLITAYRDPALRAAVLDLVAHTSGTQSAQKLRDRLAALDDALLSSAP